MSAARGENDAGELISSGLCADVVPNSQYPNSPLALDAWTLTRRILPTPNRPKIYRQVCKCWGWTSSGRGPWLTQSSLQPFESQCIATNMVVSMSKMMLWLAVLQVAVALEENCVLQSHPVAGLDFYFSSLGLQKGSQDVET